MSRINAYELYRIGAAIHPLVDIKAGMSIYEHIPTIIDAKLSVRELLDSKNFSFKVIRPSAERLIKTLDKIVEEHSGDEIFSLPLQSRLHYAVVHFEGILADELATQDIYSAVEEFGVFGKPKKYSRRWPTVFVLMPFDDALKPVYDDHIRKVLKDLQLDTARADDFFTTDSIMADVWTAINHAALIVADCTGRNPNVFYEIGIAHAIRKDTILISQSIEDVPFDLRHLRVILYELTSEGMEDFKNKLTKTVLTLDLKPPRISGAGKVHLK